jgi:hypothetical protein
MKVTAQAAACESVDDTHRHFVLTLLLPLGSDLHLFRSLRTPLVLID